jgi:hypothetical protein
MERLPLLTRASDKRDPRLAKWPFFVAGLVFFVVLFIGNVFVDQSIPSEGDITIRKTTAPLKVTLDASTDAAPYPSGWSAYFDPTLMVLPNEQSYSRAYLLKAPQAPQAVFDVSIQTPPYEFRRPYFRTSGAVSPTRAGSWSKQDPALLLETAPEPRPEPPALSLVGVYGEILHRPILELPEFPKVTRSELLMPTEISIGVDGSGAVRMAILDHSCGDDQVDELGLRLAREVSFAPAASQGERLAWGRLRVSWTVDLKSAKP